MPPNITQVQWSASNLPSGIDFNEQTGTFSGTPENIGEYVVPVQVQTNYGQDQKNVTIIVEPPMHSVYAIGRNAPVWSNKSAPDDGAFYSLNMPKAYKLTAIRGGFIAITSGKIPYACGTYNALINRYGFSSAEDMYVTSTRPVDLSKTNINTQVDKSFADIERTICGVATYKKITGSLTETFRNVYVWKVKPLSGNVSSMNAAYGCGTVNRSGQSVSESRKFDTTGGWTLTRQDGSDEWIHTQSGVFSMWEDIKGGLMFSDAISSNSFLCSDGTQRVTFTSTNTTAISPNITDLGYTAKKYFGGTFLCLSEDGKLDNDTTKFPHGAIKDAWCLSKAAYAITPANVLYEYDVDANTWSACGNYNIKKLSIPNSSNVFMLTNDGKLYHKGAKISGLTEAHDTFTELYPEHYFYDFAYEANTLALIKE